MKNLLITLISVFIFCGASAQAGKLVPDTLNKKIDTVFMKGIFYWDFSKGATTKIDSGFVVVKTAPMVFVGENNSKARTDQTATLEEKWFILPKKTMIEAKNIISFIKKD